jgi:hypothetical protein
MKVIKKIRNECNKIKYELMMCRTRARVLWVPKMVYCDSSGVQILHCKICCTILILRHRSIHPLSHNMSQTHAFFWLGLSLCSAISCLKRSLFLSTYIHACSVLIWVLTWNEFWLDLSPCRRDLLQHRFLNNLIWVRDYQVYIHTCTYAYIHFSRTISYGCDTIRYFQCTPIG